MGFFISSQGHSATRQRIQVTQGTIQADPISIQNFSDDEDNENILGSDISTVISNDLKNSGL